MKITTDESCSECGELLDVETEAAQDGSGLCGCTPPCECHVPECSWYAYEDDPVSCSECGWKGTISVDDGEAWINQ
jgi:hypothetical protein